jgi:hypothetical protein
MEVSVMSIAPTPPTNMPLRHRLLAILSLAAFKKQNRVPLTYFFEIFADLSATFPEAFSGLQVNRTASYAYSKQLDSALQSLVGSGVDIPNPSLQSIEIKDAAAARIIQRLKDSYGDEFIDSLNPIADELINRVKHYGS